MDFGVVATFTTMCNSIGQENMPIKVDLEYVRWIEDILELGYRMCYFAIGSKLITNMQEQQWSKINMDSCQWTSLPFLKDSFAFHIHVKEIFFLNDFCKLGWKLVLMNEPQGRHVEHEKNKGPNVNLLTIGSDWNFLGWWTFELQRNEVQNDASCSSSNIDE